MKRALLILTATAFGFASCSEDTAKKEPPAPQVKSVAKADPKAEKLEALKKASPTDLGELQKMLPESLAEMKRTSFSGSTNLGYATAEANYSKDKKTALHLTLYDCTGEKGASLYNSSWLTDLDKTDAGEAGYKKTISLGSGKAIEKYEAASKLVTLSFLANDKVLVVMTSKSLSVDALKEIAQKMELKIS